MLVCGSMYAQQDLTNINLDTYLLEQGARPIEGFVSSSQKMGLIKDMQALPQIKKILEIGFNAGHSSELFLSATDCEKMISFDINTHSYLKIGREFITKKFRSRFQFIEGDSREQIPKYAASHSQETFDLIFIDGGHSFNVCFSDIMNCGQLAHPETLVIIDDYVEEVKTAVDTCVHLGLISIPDVRYSTDAIFGERIWVVAKYLKQ